MIHEIEPLNYDITYQPKSVVEKKTAICFIFKEDQILVHKTELRFPQYQDCASLITKVTYLFAISGQEYYWVEASTIPEGFHLMKIREMQDLLTRSEAFAGATAYHLYTWYRQNTYCGCCGHVMQHSIDNRSMVCPECQNEVFPRISPAVIVAVTNGDKLLVTKYNGRDYKNYSLIAGFIEVGETPEHAAAREVMEEAGVHIKNLTYYKSQPWGMQSDLLIGYFAELDGSDEIHMDEEELAEAIWVSRQDIDFTVDDISLTHNMIKKFIQ